MRKTRNNISKEDQAAGKLIERTLVDAKIINDASSKLFTLINDVCCQVGLVSKVYILPSASIRKKRTKVITETIMPGLSSFALSNQILTCTAVMITCQQAACSTQLLLCWVMWSHADVNKQNVRPVWIHEAVHPSSVFMTQTGWMTYVLRWDQSQFSAVCTKKTGSMTWTTETPCQLLMNRVHSSSCMASFCFHDWMTWCTGPALHPRGRRAS